MDVSQFVSPPEEAFRWVVGQFPVDYPEFCRRGQMQRSVRPVGMPETRFGANSHRPVDWLPTSLKQGRSNISSWSMLIERCLVGDTRAINDTGLSASGEHGSKRNNRSPERHLCASARVCARKRRKDSCREKQNTKAVDVGRVR